MTLNSTSFFVNVILLGVLFLPLLLVTIDAFFRMLFMITVVGFSGQETKNVKVNAQELSLLILVVANNEGRIIGRSLQLLVEAISDARHVTLALLADNCTDQTAQVASSLGIKTYVRADGDPGKGKALSWFANLASRETLDYDLIAIFDADTMIAEDFCKNVQMAFCSIDTHMVQSFVQPVNENGLPLATLAAFSEILSQRIDDKARFRLGWTVPLRGTGMIFRRDIFLRVSPGLKTQVDDIELSLRLAELKIPVRYFPQLKIFDPKSASVLGLAMQRGRWLKGQRDVWKSWQGKLNVLSGLSLWSLLQALLLKPKVALFSMKIMLVGVFYFLNADFFIFLRMFIVFSLCVDFIYYTYGLRCVTNPRRYFFSFLIAPLFLVMWIAGWLFSFGRPGQWLRARE